MKNFRENLMHMVFFLCALTSIFAVVLICIFLFANGVPAMREIGLLDFLTGAKWKPGNDIYGILPMILGSLYITAGAIVIGVPIGLLTAVFMAFYCPKKLYGLLKPCTELLAGIPSIVYGFFGMVIIVPAVRAVAACVRSGYFWLVHSGGVHPARHYDSADHHRRVRSGAACGSDELLRGRRRHGRTA